MDLYAKGYLLMGQHSTLQQPWNNAELCLATNTRISRRMRGLKVENNEGNY
jgi:hypothetical protein